MTHLIASIIGDDIVQVRAHIGAAVDAGADMIELRVDLMEGVTDDDLLRLREQSPIDVPLILTIRSTTEGGGWDGSDTDRVSRLIELAPIADYIDVEWETWQRSANIRQKVGLALEKSRKVEKSKSQNENGGLILSKHNLRGRPASLNSDLLGMSSTPECNVIKLAWRARTVRDNFEAFELMRSSAKPIIAVCMGEEGVTSRVLAKKFGAFGAFASLGIGQETAAGQLSVEQLKKTYRWDRIGLSTKVYGLIGDPVGQSLGPVLHNAAFEQLEHDGVYLPFKVAAGYESFKAFMVEILDRPWMEFAGFSVTAPHKENAYRFLRERGGELDSWSQRFKSVNTLTIDPDGSLAGANTDLPAIMQCIEPFFSDQDLKKTKVAVLGAGGLGRAVATMLALIGSDVVIYNRTPDRARELCDAINRLTPTARCRSSNWEDRVESDTNLIIQCTSLGMAPATDESPLPVDKLERGMTVVETIYRPAETRLLRDARAEGCRTIGGMEIFKAQARGQLKIWTNREMNSDWLDLLISGS